jgi:hypothetical protein
VHYGWIRAFIAEISNDITVLDYAYENLANKAIVAGSVPEPATLALLLIGACGVAARRRRLRARADCGPHVPCSALLTRPH